MSKFIPVYMNPDFMPVDISFVFRDEMPAGKHGFCRVNGENMEFEDGTRARFWGVMMNGAACFPDRKKAEDVARRLSQAGVNIVRLHQMDDEWTAPNLYRLTAGERVTNTRELCEACMERLDYFIKCLKDRGIYITVDMTTYRRFKPGDGVVDANLLHDGSRLYAMYDPRMIELQKEFMEKFWNRVNTVTGIAYKDDPVFALCTIINENNTFIDHSVRRWYHLIPYYDNMFRDMFAAWLKENNIDYDAYGCELFNNDQPMIDFRLHLMTTYSKGMYDYLRSLGVKIPITLSNYSTNYGCTKAHETVDFCDAHAYYYDWQWGEEEKLCKHVHLTMEPRAPLANHVRLRLHGKPMFMSEWDVPFPNSYRAEGPLWFAAMNCLQNWTGMTAHTYGYGHNMSKHDLLGKVAATSTIGGVPYREGIFAIWNDPAHFGLYYHAALMVRRGDVKPAEKTVGVKITPDLYCKSTNTIGGTGAEIHQIHTVFENTEGCDEIVAPDYVYPREDAKVIVSDTGEVKRYVAKGVGVIDTPMTKSVYGKIGSGAVNKRDGLPFWELKGLSVRSKVDFATVTMSSLTDKPINESNNILLTTVGRARNHGAQFDGDKMIEVGTGPIEIEDIVADIELETPIKTLEVWAVDSDGFYSGRVDSVYEDGKLKFTVGESFACMYYLIVEP